MKHVKIKPLSVNQAWQGKRFKTDKYRWFESEMLLKLPKFEVPKGKLFINIIVCYSSNASDIDNFLKPFLDCLQKKYGFNDKQIYKLHVEKVISKDEGFWFEIMDYEKIH